MKQQLLLLGLLFLSCMLPAQRNSPDYARMTIRASRSWVDLDYVGDAVIGHRLDIHLPPEGQGPFPVVVAIYGSAWFSNSSKGNTFSDRLGQTLLENGFAVVSINHRASSDTLFPAQLHDVRAAIRFIRGNSEAFSLDTSFVGITGWSSGGHLAAMAGTTSGIGQYAYQGLQVDLEGTLGKFTDQSSAVDAVVDWFGPTDFLIMDECGSSFSHNGPKSPESSLIGGAIQDNPDKCVLANPITYVNDRNPPFLILHGDKDPLVPLCQSQVLYKKLQEAGVTAELITVEGGAHGPGVMISPNYDRMIAFFKGQLQR